MRSAKKPHTYTCIKERKEGQKKQQGSPSEYGQLEMRGLTSDISFATRLLVTTSFSTTKHRHFSAMAREIKRTSHRKRRICCAIRSRKNKSKIEWGERERERRCGEREEERSSGVHVSIVTSVNSCKTNAPNTIEKSIIKPATTAMKIASTNAEQKAHKMKRGREQGSRRIRGPHAALTFTCVRGVCVGPTGSTRCIHEHSVGEKDESSKGAVRNPQLPFCVSAN